jgi:hypothetical protein
MNKQFVLIFSFLLFLTSLFSQSTFINEINYLASDPTRAGLEIAGKAGQNLDGWSLVFYELDGTVRSIEDLQSLVIPGQQNGYGSVWFEMDQMSGSEGVALLNAAGAVQQFLSYGLGTLMGIQATEGPAAGMISQYIGSQLLPDQSLQLTGLGISYLDFSWLLPGMLTPGEVNTGQIFGLLRRLLPFLNQQSISTEDELNELTFTTFPNPATDYIRVQWSNMGREPGSNITLYLFDASGRLLQRNRFTQYESSADLDLTGLSAGQYLLRLGDGPQASVKRIVKH